MKIVSDKEAVISYKFYYKIQYNLLWCIISQV
jgi:hypothetical protein